ncbi:hypothetical protein NDU88_003377 [Pleurodeles waltl]|uniref:Uncharacterized protein n=1 Tax=Pleurodeles waltl TaxID=8319 RepID=A0AAV7W556_PLEWA|nr:hypothetical protein NDU88_003377 [Pleurodeles waltl]
MDQLRVHSTRIQHCLRSLCVGRSVLRKGSYGEALVWRGQRDGEDVLPVRYLGHVPLCLPLKGQHAGSQMLPTNIHAWFYHKAFYWTNSLERTS